MAGKDKHKSRSRRSSKTYSDQKSNAMNMMVNTNNRKQSLHRSICGSKGGE